MDYRLSDVLSKYGGQQDGEKVRIPCPIHHGKDNNCAVWIDKNDKIAANCFSQGCDVTEYFWQIYHPLPKRGPVSKELKDAAKWLPTDKAELFEAPRTFKTSKDAPYMNYECQYQYFNAEGIPLNLVTVRFVDPLTKNKAIIPYIYVKLQDGRETWVSRAPKDVQWYGLQTIHSADTVLIVEGEKSANAAWKVVKGRMGVLTWLGGSGKYRQLDLSVLEGKKVILWPDYDKPGFKWAWEGESNLYDVLSEMGCDVSAICWEDGGEGGDCADVESTQAMWDILNTATNPAKFKLERIFNQCLAADALHMTEEMAKTIPCGVTEYCKNCRYAYIPATEHPIDILNTDPVIHSYAYIAREDVYVSFDSLTTYQPTIFNNMAAHLPGYGLSASSTAHRQFQETNGSLKVHEREFRPGKQLMIDGKLNLAKELKWTPCEGLPNRWLRLADHLFTEKEKNHILNWLAFTIQQPDKKINHTLLIVGDQGVGKSLFFSPIEKALHRVGQHKTVNSQQVQSQFNDFLVGTKLLTMEELNMAGAGYTGSNRLKEWQAAPPDYINVNPKFSKPFEIPNIVNIIAYSNFDLPVKLEKGQRRWYAVQTMAPRLADEEWYDYDTYNEMIDDPYVDKILTYLSRRDITSFNHTGNAPVSDASRAMELMSIPGMRDLKPLIDSVEWADLEDLRRVKQILEYEGGHNKNITDNNLRKILPAMGWINLERCMKIDGRSVRPWASRRGELYQNMNTADLIGKWKQLRRGEAIP